MPEPDDPPDRGLTGEFEIVTDILRPTDGPRLFVTKHVFTFHDGRLVAVSEPREEAVDWASGPPGPS